VLAGAGALAVATMLVLAVGGPQPSDVGSASPATPSPSASLRRGEASGFGRPFGYTLPPELPTRVITPSSNRAEIPLGSGGITVWIVREGLADACDPTSERFSLQPTVDAAISHLRSIEGLSVSNLVDVTVDGRPAKRLDLHVDGTCAQHHFWADPGWNVTMNLVPEEASEVTLLTVDGDTVAIEVWGEDLEDWMEPAQEFIDSIEFRAP
jgi:hypothetical protein